MRHEWEEGDFRYLAQDDLILCSRIDGTSSWEGVAAGAPVREMLRVVALLAAELGRGEFLKGQNSNLANSCEQLKKRKKFLEKLADAAAVWEGTHADQDFLTFQRLVHQWTNQHARKEG